MSGAAGPEAEPEPGPLTLALVVPVWNDAGGLARLVASLAGLPLAQLILVDDASSPPLDPAAAGATADALGCTPRLLRLEQQGGAGRARNLGLAEVTASHVLFFDSDDLLLPDFATLLAEIAADPAARAADFTLFRHTDSRAGNGPLASDQVCWAAALGPAAAAVPAPPRRLGRAGLLALAQIAAYPWNKVYRTGFLRAHGIRCTEIPVHNDIELHWMSFLAADTVFCSPRLGCAHGYASDGARLTNRTGADRFRVFEALAPPLAALAADPARRDLLVPFTRFLMNVFGWIGETLEPPLRQPFAAQAARFLRSMDPALFTLLALRDPDLALRLTGRIREAAA